MRVMAFWEEPDLDAPADSVRIWTEGFEGQAPPGRIVRVQELWATDEPTPLKAIGIKFNEPCCLLLKKLSGFLTEAAFIRDELLAGTAEPDAPPPAGKEPSVADFHRVDNPDLFRKCRDFYGMVKDFQKRGRFQSMYRVTLTSGLDHRIVVFNPLTRCEQEMICFDSNSYLGLHKHPRVLETAARVMKRVGYGTPSAQLLAGTTRYLRELEEAICSFHGREETLVFPSGYAANLGAILGLVRQNDAVIRDRLSHTSIHDACRMCDSRLVRTYPTGDMAALGKFLENAGQNASCKGKLIATDGVFSMHGKVVDLPPIVELARKHGARLLVDEAHSTGVIGETGRGVEELYNLPGSIDILVGTFSKAPGTVGGYVCGSREVIYYLRFFAHPGMFTAALPAHICAGVTEAFRCMADDPRPRQRLWKNVRQFVPALREAGFNVSSPESPIVTIFIGAEPLLWAVSADLFQSGLKCGNAAFPAVPRGESILRLAVNARHTQKDLEETVSILAGVGRKYGILHRTPEEIKDIGRRLVGSEKPGSKTETGASEE